jgi:hypothetical protein
MPFAQPGQHQQSGGTIGVEHQRHLAGGSGPPQQLNEHTFCVRMSIISQRSHGQSLPPVLARGKSIRDDFAARFQQGE